MSARIQTLPADTDKPCNCCGRTHRKLYLYQGYWMGKSCIEQYAFYTSWPTNIIWTTDAYWMKIAAKVTAMVKGN